MKNLSDSQRKYLRGLGHSLKPVIIVGDSGLSDSLLEEFSSTIDHHELIKVRVRTADRERRNTLIQQLCEKQSAHLVAKIGSVALIYRHNANRGKDKPRILLPPK